MTTFVTKVASKFVDEAAGVVAKAVVGIVVAAVLALAAFITGHPDVGLGVAIATVAILSSFILGLRACRQSARKQESLVKARKYRGLLFDVDYSTQFPKVLNRDLGDALCWCGSSIVATDNGRYDGSVNYLQCSNGHFVGNEMEYSEFARIQDEKREQARLQRELEAKARQEAREKLLKEQGITGLPAPNYDAGAGSPSNLGGYLIPTVPENVLAQDFYNGVIWELEQVLQREKVGQIKVIEIKPGS